MTEITIRNATLYVGDVLSVLRTLPSDSVHCVVTSPPYWGLRSYGTEPQVWGGDEACEHEFIAWSMEAYLLAKQAGAAGSVNASRELIAGSDIQQNAKGSLLAKQRRTKSKRGKNSNQVVSESDASSRKRSTSGLIDVPISVENTPQKIPNVGIGNIGHPDSEALAGIDSEYGQSVAKFGTPDRPSPSDGPLLCDLSPQRGCRGNEITHEECAALVDTDKTDRPIVADISIGSHEAEPVGKFPCPPESTERDPMSAESVFDEPFSAALNGADGIPAVSPMPFRPRDFCTTDGATHNLAGRPPLPLAGDGTCPPPVGVPTDDLKDSAADGTSEPGSGSSVHAPMVCRKCGAIKCELGSEPTIELFITHLVEVFREVRRVLHPSGICMVNLGDSYAAGKSGRADSGDFGRFGGQFQQPKERKPTDGLKPKDLCLVPWRFVLAAQADGWYVRDVIVWHKPAPMPESVRDRCTKSWEPIFMLTKSVNYFWDAEAVKEAGVGPEMSQEDYARALKETSEAWYPRVNVGERENGHKQDNNLVCGRTPPGGRNLRNVWKISTEPEPAAHFACFPSGLPERCIKAGTSEKGCCPKCLKPWERVMSGGHNPYPGSSHDHSEDLARGGTQTHESGIPAGTIMRRRNNSKTPPQTTGWRPSCTCEPLDPIPCTVLDCFAGSGTTLKVAEQLGRRSIGIELSARYAHEIAVPKIKLALTDRSEKPLKPLKGQLSLIP